MNKLFVSFLILLAMLSSGQVLSVEPTFTALFSNKAIRGYDTVAYFTENKPIKGKAEFSAEYRGAMWMFSSQENLDLFLQDPEKYAPQYGGYCAFAVAKNTTASIKPELFTIHEGKLYLNYSNEINDKWLANKDDYIKRADENWPAILAK